MAHSIERHFLSSLLLFIILIQAVLFFTVGVTCAAEQKAPGWVGKAISIQGAVEIQRAHTTEWVPLKTDTLLYPSDIIRVLENSRAAVMLENQTVLRLDQNTTITFSGPLAGKSSWIEMLNGAVHFLSLLPCRLKVVTPFVNGDVEGTEFMVRVEEHKALFHLFQGQVLMANALGRLLLAAGQSGVAGKDQCPVLTALEVRPRDAVRWTLYYPLIFDYHQEDFPAGDERATLERSLAFFRQGDIVKALEGLTMLPEAARSKAPIPVYEAGLLLTVGRVDEAQAVIDRGLAASPANNEALALAAIIAVVQNQKEKALELARQAVALNPAAAGPSLALSYAYQAGFDIDAALVSGQEAAAKEPDNAVALARLAELWLATGHLDEALSAAGRAVAINPRLSHTQTVMGFAHLSRIETDKAKECFRLAIELDQAAPLPRLGLGLALIREGDLAAGREQIEIGVALDPGNSLVRSYLGKAYFEEYQDRPAENQFTMAKELDPLDPTPWLYDALRKQTNNQPVAALQDLQKSIELNDNRAVYWYRLLLDEDLAVRSTSLGRIYDELGFQQLGLMTALESIQTDPANYSAHRLLSDSYASMPRHQNVRVSELLQSQLLQPINITPLQPELAESKMQILNGAGPSSPSFYDFSTLFNRNQFSMLVSGITGQDGMLGDEVILSGVNGNLSYSMGQFHYASDGYRENNDQTQDIYLVFGQISLSPQDSIQVEIRSRKQDNGDLGIYFHPEFFSPNRRDDLAVEAWRMGYHRVLSPDTDLLVSFIMNSYDNGTESNYLLTPRIFMGQTGNKVAESNLLEFQQLWRTRRLNLVSGLGVLNGHSENTGSITFSTTGFLPFEKTIPANDSGSSDLLHGNIYTYWQVNIPRPCTWTFGISGDSYKETEQIRQINPKGGLSWDLLPTTTFRLALFKSLSKTLVSKQTLEPTQVAGFNQFFDDEPGTESRRYGVGLDHKFTSTLFSGLEVSERELELNQQESTERTNRGYVYWTPFSRLAVSAEFFDDHQQKPSSMKDQDTFRVPLGIKYFLPNGFFSALKNTYVVQKLETYDKNGEVTERENFWMTDLAIGYRLPERRGLITLEGRNLFCEEFGYNEIDPNNPTVYPHRLFFVRLTLAY